MKNILTAYEFKRQLLHLNSSNSKTFIPRGPDPANTLILHPNDVKRYKETK